jgi:hypothetical protein
MRTEPALNVVVYRNPGPDDNTIETHAQTVARKCSIYSPGGGLWYVTLVEPDFNRVWEGVNRRDAFGPAYGVLRLLGPKARQVIGRQDDFVFGWIGEQDEEYGNVLLLEIIPKPHMIVWMN